MYLLKQDYKNSVVSVELRNKHFVINGEIVNSLNASAFYNKKCDTFLYNLNMYEDCVYLDLDEIRRNLKSAHSLLKETGKLVLYGDDKTLNRISAIVNDIFGYNNFIQDDIHRYQSQTPRGSVVEHNAYFDNKYIFRYFSKNKSKFTGFGDILEYTNFKVVKSGTMVEGSKNGNFILSDKHFPFLIDVTNNDIFFIKKVEYNKLIKITTVDSRTQYLNELRLKYENEGYIFVLPYEGSIAKEWRKSYDVYNKLLKSCRKFFKKDVKSKKYLEGLEHLFWFSYDENSVYKIDRYYIRDGYFKRSKNTILNDSNFLKKNAVNDSIYEEVISAHYMKSYDADELPLNYFSDELSKEFLMYNSLECKSHILTLGDAHYSMMRNASDLNRDSDKFNIEITSLNENVLNSNIDALYSGVSDNVIVYDSFKSEELDNFDYPKIVSDLENICNFLLINHSIFTECDLDISSSSYKFYKVSDGRCLGIYFNYDECDLIEYTDVVKDLSNSNEVKSIIINSNEDYFKSNDRVFNINVSKKIKNLVNNLVNKRYE